jgi:hypothetical protein
MGTVTTTVRHEYNKGVDVEARHESATVGQRHAGRKVLLAAALGLVLAGAAACGTGDDSAELTNAAPTATATPAPTDSATPAASDSATATPTEDIPKVSAADPIVITAPANGTTVARTFTVTGRSQTTEGTVLWQLFRGADAVMSDIAQGGSDSAAPFKFSVTAPAAGTYTIRVFEESAMDGAAKNAVERTVTVR